MCVALNACWDTATARRHLTEQSRRDHFRRHPLANRTEFINFSKRDLINERISEQKLESSLIKSHLCTTTSWRKMRSYTESRTVGLEVTDLVVRGDHQAAANQQYELQWDKSLGDKSVSTNGAPIVLWPVANRTVTCLMTSCDLERSRSRSERSWCLIFRKPATIGRLHSTERIVVKLFLGNWSGWELLWNSFFWLKVRMMPFSYYFSYRYNNLQAYHNGTMHKLQTSAAIKRQI